MISLGALRRFVHPLLFRLWSKFVKDRELVTRSDGFAIKVLPTVFHPSFFGSSRIFAKYLVTTGLSGKRFLDLGTGSGIIGLYAARAGAMVTAVDINPRAVECASENASRAGLRLDCRQSDLFSSLAEEKFDVIAWNPPFFPKRVESPAQAAFNAGAGYEVISAFAHGVREHLAPDGRAFLVLSMDLDMSEWSRIFGNAGLRLDVRCTKRWGWEMMVIKELAEMESTDFPSAAPAGR
jgi:release factor glutamine methyltransferase